MATTKTVKIKKAPTAPAAPAPREQRTRSKEEWAAYEYANMASITPPPPIPFNPHQLHSDQWKAHNAAVNRVYEQWLSDIKFNHMNAYDRRLEGRARARAAEEAAG